MTEDFAVSGGFFFNLVKMKMKVSSDFVLAEWYVFN